MKHIQAYEKFKNKVNENSDSILTIEELRLQLAHYIEVLENAEPRVTEMSPNTQYFRNPIYIEELSGDISFNYIVIEINSSSIDLDEAFTIESFNKFHDSEEYLRLTELSNSMKEFGYKLEFQFNDDVFALIISNGK